MSGNAEVDARRPGDEEWWILSEACGSVWLETAGLVQGRRGSSRLCLTSSCIRGLRGRLEAFCRSLVPGEVWVRKRLLVAQRGGQLAQQFVPLGTQSLSFRNDPSFLGVGHKYSAAT